MTVSVLPAAAGAGLTVLVVYRRPAQRRGLLVQLADLGMFVVECVRTNGVPPFVGGIAADMALAFVGREHLDTVRDLAAVASRPLLVCHPDGDEPAPYLEAGALRCINDSGFQASAARFLAEAAAIARGRKAAGLAADGLGLGAIRFDPHVPSLALAGRTRLLSRSEAAVLRRLYDAGGYPVDADDLERFATPEGQSMHSGFLKATVLRLRRKLRDLGADPECIRTVRGVGYALWLEGNPG